MGHEKVMDHKNAQKKRTWPLSSHLDRTSLVNKGFIMWSKDYTKNVAFAVTKPAIPRRQESPILEEKGRGFDSNSPWCLHSALIFLQLCVNGVQKPSQS